MTNRTALINELESLLIECFNTIAIDLNKDRSGKAQANIILQRNDSNPISPGNYTIGISATDGTVTKSIFRYLFVK
jgi:hypothetical protein